jgi:hypothetical protein
MVLNLFEGMYVIENTIDTFKVYKVAGILIFKNRLDAVSRIRIGRLWMRMQIWQKDTGPIGSGSTTLVIRQY